MPLRRPDEGAAVSDPRLLPIAGALAGKISPEKCKSADHGCDATGMDDSTQRHTAIGAGLGAVAGALIGGDVTGALLGAGLGGAGGYVWSKQMEDKRVVITYEGTDGSRWEVIYRRE